MFPVCLTPIIDEKDDKKRLDVDIHHIFIGQLNFAMWRVLNRLYETIAYNEGVIFGGSVRDFIDRKNATRVYYEEMEKQKNSVHTADILFNRQAEGDMVNFNSRRRLPKDIDVFIAEENVKKLLEDFRKNGFIYKKNDVTGISYFSKGNTPEQSKFIKHIRVVLSFDRHNPVYIFLESFIGRFERRFDFGKIKFRIDLIVKNPGCPESLKPPFGNPDFRCNMLFMHTSRRDRRFPCISTDISQIESTFCEENSQPKFAFAEKEGREFAFAENKDQERALAIIQDDITNKRAVLMKGSIDIFRLYKLRSKGYTIDYSYYLKTNPVMFSGKPYDIKLVNPVPFIPLKGLPEKHAKCTACKEPFKEPKAIRIDCPCSNQYHYECFVNKLKDGLWKCDTCDRVSDTCLCEIFKIVVSMFTTDYKKAKEKIHQLNTCTKCK